MSTSTEPEAPASSTETNPPIVDAISDSFLVAFAAEANQSGAEMDLTLFVEGTTISGTLTSMDNFFEGSLKSHRDFLEGLGNSVKAPKGEDAPSPYFLHLRDVKILSGAHVVNTPFVRVLISRISGWSFGTWL